MGERSPNGVRMESENIEKQLLLHEKRVRTESESSPNRVRNIEKLYLLLKTSEDDVSMMLDFFSWGWDFPLPRVITFGVCSDIGQQHDWNHELQSTCRVLLVSCFTQRNSPQHSTVPNSLVSQSGKGKQGKTNGSNVQHQST